MKIIAVGDEYDPSEYEVPPNTEWIIYEYSRGAWEGSGIAYCKTMDGKYWTRSLGHCSCYGAWDGGNDWDELFLSDLMMHTTGSDRLSLEVRKMLWS